MKRMNLFGNKIKAIFRDSNFNRLVVPGMCLDNLEIREISNEELLDIVHQELSFGDLETSKELLKDLDMVYKNDYPRLNEEIMKLRKNINFGDLDYEELYTNIFAALDDSYTYTEGKAKADAVFNQIDKEYTEGLICDWNINDRIRNLIK